MKHLHARQSGFTLIELLVVISIIAILASLSIPVVGRAIESARRAQANTEVSSLATAIRAYYNEYSRFPQQGEGIGEYIDGNGELMNILRAINGPGNVNHANNRRRIVFMEIAERSLSEGSPADFVDPWDDPYRVVVDINFDNQINVPQHGTLENRLIAVWSLGGNADDPSRHMTSWQ